MSEVEVDYLASSPASYYLNESVHVADDEFKLNVPYTVCEVLVAVCAVVGNALVIIVFRRERRLRRRTNYYIISLAAADLLVGLLGIPFAVLASVGLPKHLYACLFTVSLLVVLCTISIFCLVAVSVDRYWAILHPMAYSRNVRTKTAIGIIGLCWFLGSLIGFLPLLGWHGGGRDDQQCSFTEVMNYNYLVFLYFATIIFPALLLAAFYAHIYQVVLKQLRQIVTMNPTPGSNAGAQPSAGNGGTMLRVFGAAQKREVKATKNLSIIVFFFIICWIPLYTINCIQAFCPKCNVSLTLTNCCIILSHLNSAGNPLLYAYHLRDFRAALKHLLCGLLGMKEEIPEYHGPRASLGSHVHHGAYNSRNNSVHSLRDQFKVSSVKNYSDFKVANSCIPPLPPDASPRMWTVPEVPSCDEESGRRPSSQAQVPSPVRLRSMAGRVHSDGKVNSGYIDDSMDFEVGDDDVFVESTTLETLTSTADVLDELPFRYCSSTSSLWDDRTDKCSPSPLAQRLRGSRTSASSVESTGDKDNVRNSLLIVEAEINNSQVGIDDRTRLSLIKSGKNPVLNGNGDLNMFNNVNITTSDGTDTESNRPKDSPLKQLTRSPLKFVGELLFNNSNFLKELSKNEETELEKSPRNGSVVFESTAQPTDDSSTRVT